MGFGCWDEPKTLNYSIILDKSIDLSTPMKTHTPNSELVRQQSPFEEILL